MLVRSEEVGDGRGGKRDGRRRDERQREPATGKKHGDL